MRSLPLSPCVSVCAHSEVSQWFHRCLHFYTPGTHTLSWGSDPEQSPVKEVRFAPDTLCRGAPEACELGQMVNRCGEGCRGGMILVKLLLKKEAQINSHPRSFTGYKKAA